MEQGEQEQDELESLVVVPGDILSADLSGGWLRGHGTFVENGSLLANVGGAVERVNRLVSVRPVQARFVGEVGDVVVGRVKEVGSKRWRVDVRARQDGVLMLSAVNLAGGAQRRRTYEDQLAMRTLFREDD
jgi:exosome complex component RRP4